MREIIKVMIKRCGEDPQEVQIYNDLKSLETIIGGHVDEMRMLRGDGILILSDEQAEEKRLPVNLRRYQGIYFRGTLIFCRACSPDYVSLTDDDIKLIKKRVIGWPQGFYKSGIII